MIKSIFLQDDEEIFVDEEDFERVRRYTWTSAYYGNHRRITTHIKGKCIYLNSLILEGSFQIKKNNYFTKSNLTTSGNKTRWSKPMLKGASSYKGVYRNGNKTKNIWSSSITVDGKQKFLGSFDNQESAAKAYNEAVKEYWDGQGYLNEINKNNKIVIFKSKKRQFYDARILSKSSWRGVYKKNTFYEVRKSFKGKNAYFGTTDSPQKAALIYNKCVLYLYGDDAILNDVPMTDELKEFISNWEIPVRIKILKEEN